MTKGSNFWVIGGEFGSMNFHKLVEGSAQVRGPFKTRKEAEDCWREVRTKLSELPAKDGVYLAHENCPQTFTERNRDHPSMLGALGVLPGVKVDREIMRATLKRVFRDWKYSFSPALAGTIRKSGAEE